ncbi:MAG: MbnH family di-heme enzyme [Acidobacteriota bacterium]
MPALARWRGSALAGLSLVFLALLALSALVSLHSSAEAGLGTPKAERPSLSDSPTATAISWPQGFPPPPPEVAAKLAGPEGAARIELGRKLFFEPRLAVDGRTSCAQCHQPRLAFTDGLPQAVGATGESHPRNSPSLVNLAWAPTLTWDDPTIVSLAQHARTPLLAEHPVEMGLEGRWGQVRRQLAADPRYRQLHRRAFPTSVGGDDEALTLDQVTTALEAFQLTLISADSPYDRWTRGGEEALSPAARRGLALFFSARVGCARCHRGFTFGGPAAWDGAPLFLGERRRAAYRNTGLYDIDGRGSYPASNPGLIRHTGQQSDRGRFRIPTLRNVAVTAPYMHDGSLETLEAVIDHYAAGGRVAQRGWPSAAVDEEMNPFQLSTTERQDLLAFLHSLTDESFLAAHQQPETGASAQPGPAPGR